MSLALRLGVLPIQVGPTKKTIDSAVQWVEEDLDRKPSEVSQKQGLKRLKAGCFFPTNPLSRCPEESLEPSLTSPSTCVALSRILACSRKTVKRITFTKGDRELGATMVTTSQEHIISAIILLYFIYI